jgi:hypothetical protein
MSGTPSGLSFNDDHKFVIQGVLHDWEQNGGRFGDSTNNPAELILNALLRILKEDWNIVVYKTYESEAGYGTCYHYENRIWVYGVSTSCCSHDNEAIKSFMQREFGWARVAGIDQLQQSAQMNSVAAFRGRWRVHVVKGAGGWASSLKGFTINVVNSVSRSQLLFWVNFSLSIGIDDCLRDLVFYNAAKPSLTNFKRFLRLKTRKTSATKSGKPLKL